MFLSGDPVTPLIGRAQEIPHRFYAANDPNKQQLIPHPKTRPTVISAQALTARPFCGERRSF